MFIIFTKASSVPAIFSAIATTASFPLATAIPLNKSLTLIFSFVSSNIWLPPILEAFSDTVTISSQLMIPFSILSIISNIDIILVIEAGTNLSCEFFSNIISPVLASIKIALLAFVAKFNSSALINFIGNNNTTVINTNRNFFIISPLLEFMKYLSIYVYLLIYL